MKVTVRQPNKEFIAVSQKKDSARLKIEDLTPNFIQVDEKGDSSKVTISKPGINGLDGSKIYSGIGEPLSSLGKTGDYYIDTFTARLYGPKPNNNTWNVDYVSLGNSLISEEFVLTNQMINDKSLALSFTPSSSRDVEFSVYGGVEQRPNVDFFVENNLIKWEQLALELLLDVGTVVSVRYTIN